MPSPSRPLAVLAATVLTAGLALSPAVATAAIVADPITHSADDAALSLSPLGTFETGIFDASAAEIVQAHGDRLFVVNAQAGAVSVLDYSDPTAMTEEFSITSDGVANSVAIRADGLGAIAFEAPDKVGAGHVVFFDATAPDAASAVLGDVTVGALPDMVAISPDGTHAVVANEGEPADDFSVDPEGTVSVIALPAAKTAPAQGAVRTADFHGFEAGGTKTLPADIRVFGPAPHGDDLPVSRNLEPEYVAIDGGTAYVALQEANGVAVVDIASATITDVWALGFKDLGLEGNGIDPSDRDPNGAPTFGIRTYPGLHGVYMPDGLVSYVANGQTYLVSANEGDAREWGDYVEPVRVKDLAKDGFGPVCADSTLAPYLKDGELGRLNVTKELGFDDERGCYAELYAFGGRSFSIWTTDGTQVFDSGDAFERITHAANPDFFNSNHAEANLEGRSDDKGPEPESVAIGTLSRRTYAFVGFERVGGIAVFDITEPAASRFVTYVDNRDFTADPESPDAGDLGPEGIAFIPAASSATGAPLLAVGNEVSGTTTLFAVEDLLAPVSTGLPIVSGAADAGSTLSATPGTWTPGVGGEALAFSYQWLRDGSPISGAVKSTYRAAVADQGRAISVRVTATQGAASVAVDSAPVTVRRIAVAAVVASPTLASTKSKVTVTVRIIATGGAKATGEVRVTVGGRTFTGTAVDGVAKIAVGTLKRGLLPITASYVGDSVVSPTAGLGIVLVL